MNLTLFKPCFIAVWMALIIPFAYIVFPQDSNVHLGATAGVSSNAGLTGPTFGITGGGDYRTGNTLISGDCGIFRLQKINGGAAGYQYDCRGTLARFLRPNFAIQGGIQESRYKVEKYGKSALEIIGGVRFTGKEGHRFAEFNGRKDLTSENKINAVEFQFTGYERKHVFFRINTTLASFVSGGQKYTSWTQSGAVGFWF